MFAGLVENLGLKDGLAEFKEQFSKDAKSTIAETKFAQDRGINLATLDDWEQQLQEQARASADELHERTIGLAKETLAKDETIAQLLDLKQPTRDDDVAEGDGQQGVGDPRSESASSPTSGAAAEDDSGASPQASETHAAAASGGGALATSAASSTGAEGGSAPNSVRSGAPGLRGGPADAPARSRGAPEKSERLLKAEAEVRARRDERGAAEERLAQARAGNAELEARWSDIAALAQDARRQSAEANREVAALQVTLEAVDANLLDAKSATESLTAERDEVARRRADLEAAFQERLDRELGQKEQELLEEVTYLRRSQEIKEKRLRDLVAEKEQLERRLGTKASAAVADESGAAGALEWHVALARAFGHDDSKETACLRQLDGPSLRFAAALFMRPALRRAFFILTVIAWILALSTVLSPGKHMVQF